MLTDYPQRLIRWLRRVITEPRGELNRWQSAVRFTYDLARYGARQLSQDRAAQMASALTYCTLFSLLPVLVMATVLVRAVKGVDQFQQLAHEVFVSIGLEQVKLIPPEEVAGGAAGQGMTLADWLERLVHQAANLRLEALGWVGLAVLIYAAISLMVTIEDSFNTIYRAPGGRSWSRRLPIYWFVLTLSPVFVGLMMYLNQYFESWIHSVGTFQWVLIAVGVLWNILLAWIFLGAVYLFVPNTTVAWRCALAGSLAAAVLLNIWFGMMGIYLNNAFSISRLYGSLGLIPLFMYWVYVNWLIVLFGLELSMTLQTLGATRELEKFEPRPQPTGIVDPASVIAVMEVVAVRFADAQPTSAHQAAEAAALPELAVARMFDALVAAGLLHRLERHDAAVTLARPAESVHADQLIRIGFDLADEGEPARRSELFQRLRRAQLRLASRITLANLASHTVPESAP
jgi:membrane protein